MKKRLQHEYDLDQLAWVWVKEIEHLDPKILELTLEEELQVEQLVYASEHEAE